MGGGPGGWRGTKGHFSSPEAAQQAQGGLAGARGHLRSRGGTWQALMSDWPRVNPSSATCSLAFPGQASPLPERR